MHMKRDEEYITLYLLTMASKTKSRKSVLVESAKRDKLIKLMHCTYMYAITDY